MKKLRLKKSVKDFLIGGVMIWSIIVIGVLVLNARFGYLNQQKSTDQISYQTVSTNN